MAEGNVVDVDKILLNRKNVQRIVDDLSPRQMNTLIAAGKFPAPITLGDRNARWLLTEIQDYVEKRKALRAPGRRDKYHPGQPAVSLPPLDKPGAATPADATPKGAVREFCSGFMGR